ncbi:MAG TPA: hypothetical protein VM029_15070 [Opitutaceae bacterium]|nr:hypothetical protein [Opitutaceae bacterium]
MRLPSRSSRRRGSAFITTLVFCVILLALVGSVLKYATFERRINNRAKLLLEARTAAEGISEYGIAQVKKVLEANRQFTDSTWSSTDESLFVTGGTYAGTIDMPPSGFWGGGHIVTSGAEAPTMHVGKILQLAGGGLYFIDPTNPDNDTDPLKGKRAFRYDLDVLSGATAADSFGGGNVTKYMKQTFSIRAVPLFANAVYYNMDLELWPGPVMIVTGSTHTNARLFARPAGTADLTFAGPVTAVKGIWTKIPVVPYPWHQFVNDDGQTATNNTTAVVYILPAGTTVAKPLRLGSATSGYATNLAVGTWVESTWNLNGASYATHQASTETATTKENYANWIAQTFKGNVLTHVNGITPTNLQGIPDYSYTYGSLYPTPPYLPSNDPTNRARALIERPRLTSETGYVAAEEAIKYSRSAGLYIVANTTGANARGHQPDGTEIDVAARSYRAFMNDTTTSPPTITEVLLPGQNTYGFNTSTAAPYANPHATHRDMRPIVQLFNLNWTTNVETATPRRMVDMRRTGVPDANLASATTTFNHAAARSSTNSYIPKNLFMIDIDLTELKKSVDLMTVAMGTTYTTTAKYYKTGIADKSGTASDNWANHINRADAALTTVTLTDNNRIITTSSTLTNAFSATRWNGGVYIESVAADNVTTGANAAETKAKSHNNRNSGVRLINGRGTVPSVGNQGFTLATNDAVYILGHFNADGLASTPTTVAVTVPPSPGASTGHNYETGELPASIVADAVTLLSQPVVEVQSSPTLGQRTGWNDRFSSLYYGTGNYLAHTSATTGWDVQGPSGTNDRDGDRVTTAYAYRVPYDSDSGTWTVWQNTDGYKLEPAFTEYSMAILCGLVPTGKNGVNQNSGGLHNFPRFLEDWTGIDCRIRGSMVALFECRVATEPWSLRVYDPPNRIWGFNLLYDTGVMPPLTPKTIHFRRSMANDITKADYNTKLTAWGYTALP